MNNYYSLVNNSMNLKNIFYPNDRQYFNFLILHFIQNDYDSVQNDSYFKFQRTCCFNPSPPPLGKDFGK